MSTLTRKELQTELRAMREKGLTSVKLTIKTSELQKIYDGLKKENNTQLPKHKAKKKTNKEPLQRIKEEKMVIMKGKEFLYTLMVYSGLEKYGAPYI